MRISIFGTGYVGLVTGVCFAEMGNDVICVDIDSDKVRLLSDGKSPIYEPGLEPLLISNLRARRIQFTPHPGLAIENSDILFIAVGTPSDEDGSADLLQVLQVAETIASQMTSYKLIVVKSTVPVGTCHQIKERIEQVFKRQGQALPFDVVSNPEFLREGNAIEDCLKPHRVIVGCESAKAAEMMENLYEPFLKSGNPHITMDSLSAEMTKYAANAMLATKISLMNEISRVCEKTGADVESVRRGIGSDYRIGPHFIFAGVGYGGSCFPKDVRALVKAGSEFSEDLQILKAVESTNLSQRKNFFGRIKSKLGDDLRDQKIAVWGVSFKPGTDDIRHAPSLDLLQNFLDEGMEVSVYDPVASSKIKDYFNGNPRLRFSDDQYESLQDANCLVIVTEWKSFKEPNFEKIKTRLKKPLIFDGRNLFSLKVMKNSGIEYHSIGRPTVYHELN